VQLVIPHAVGRYGFGGPATEERPQVLDSGARGRERPIALQHIVFEVGLRRRVERKGRPVGHWNDFERGIFPSAHLYDLRRRRPRHAAARSDVHTFALVAQTMKSIAGGRTDGDGGGDIGPN
jgi:hypothetical protein